MKIKKSTGEYEDFNIEKLKLSLERSGATKDNVKYTCHDILNFFSQKKEIRSSEIYRRAYRILKKIEKEKVVFRYTIKKAINELGPTGFPFEKFVSGIYRALGWKKVRNGVKVAGECVSHEVDLIAEKDDKKIVGELKFHNKRKIRTDLKVALYVKERDDDLERAGFFEGKKPVKALITNTTFSTKAKDFGKCIGMKLLSWDYPNDYNLHHMVMDSKLKPVTCLTSINKKQKKELAEKGFVFCGEVAKMVEKDFKQLNFFSKNDIYKVIKEAKSSCSCK